MTYINSRLALLLGISAVIGFDVADWGLFELEGESWTFRLIFYVLPSLLTIVPALAIKSAPKTRRYATAISGGLLIFLGAAVFFMYGTFVVAGACLLYSLYTPKRFKNRLKFEDQVIKQPTA